jgi:hypothetical protein
MKKHKKGSLVFLEFGGILLKGSCYETDLISDKNTVD